MLETCSLTVADRFHALSVVVSVYWTVIDTCFTAESSVVKGGVVVIPSIFPSSFNALSPVVKQNAFEARIRIKVGIEGGLVNEERPQKRECLVRVVVDHQNLHEVEMRYKNMQQAQSFSHTSSTKVRVC